MHRGSTPEGTRLIEDGTVWAISEDVSVGRNFEVIRKAEQGNTFGGKFYLYSEPLEEWILACLAK